MTSNSVELKMTYNPEKGEVETLVDGEVLISSGKEEFQSWVTYANEQNQPTEEERARAELEANLEAARAEIEDLKREKEATPVVEETPESSPSAEGAEPSGE